MMESFLEACGANGPLTLDVEGPQGLGIGRLVLPRPFALIGRDRRADVMLDHDLVSRRHAFLVIIEGWPFFIDLESRSGSSLGDSPSPVESGWLSPGQDLRIGPYRIRHAGTINGSDRHGEGGGGATPPLSNPLLARSADSNELPRVALQFESRSSGYSVWRMSQVMAVLGSSARCKVRLYDPNVSKHHCTLVRTPSGLWVIDLLGRDGITVNGELVRFALLGEGDELRLGRIMIRPTFADEYTRPDGASPWGGGISIGSASSSMPVRMPGRTWGTSTAAMPAPAPLIFPGSTPAPAPGPALAPNSASFPSPFDSNGQTPADGMPALPSINSNEPALAMLLNHFGQMQQQMADQFQQQMMMMLQMFNGMHREQMGMIREELDRLRELSMEVHTLRAKMATAPTGRPNLGQGQGQIPGHAAATPRPPWNPHPAATPAPSTPTPTAPPLWPAAPPSSPSPSSPKPNPTPGAVGQPAPPPPLPPLDPVAKGEPVARPSTPPPDAANLDPAVHDWLNTRLVAIQREQQTRWQKILGMLGQNA
jgi:pSer/pThr/pTyr-binding forkhead associated (FHA) protein